MPGTYPATAHAAGVIFVKPGGSGTGATWADAKDLAPALLAAASGDTLWVAAGTYKPTQGAARTATFRLKSGVAIYGGFAGTESQLGARDWTANTVTLSGDIGIAGDSSDNSYHVVTGATGATLDGVTISGGYINEPAPNNAGGGMYNSNSSPTLTNVIFSGNTASNLTYGGGMYNSNSSPTLTNVTFRVNSAYMGGGMYSDSGSSPTLTNVTFSGNTASSGGGMYNAGGSPTLTNVTFSGNRASSGGGMYNSGGSPSLSNAVLSGNSATSGGGMYNSGSDPALTNVTLSGNGATSGGGIYNAGSSPTVRNSIIWGNTAPTGPVMHNNDGASVPVVSFSLIEGGYAGGAHIIAADPLFVTPVPAAVPNTSGDLHVQAASPAINAGDNAAATAGTDRDGSPRIVGVAVDMGAYELLLPLVRSISRAAGATNPTNAASVAFAVAFTMPVGGVDAADFALATTGAQGGATISGVSGGPTTWAVTVSTVSGASGAIRLDLIDTDSIVSIAPPAIALGGSGVENGSFRAGEAYTLDREPPALSLSAPPPINLASATGYLVDGACTAGDGDVVVRVGSVSGRAACGGGRFRAALNVRALADGGGIAVSASQTDATNNTGGASATTSKDTIAPTVQIGLAASPSRLSPIPVAVTFREQVAGFTAADLMVTHATISGLVGGGAAYTFDLTPSALGAVTVNIAAGAATDAAGNPNRAAAQLSYAPPLAHAYLPLICRR